MIQKEININYFEYQHSELLEEDKVLVSKANEFALKSYSPYSNFRVGVSVLLENGLIISGNNQENAAYPSGLCAERVALFFANANYPDNHIKTIAIAAFDNNNNQFENIITPCGACRQVIVEIENRFEKNCKILLTSKDKVIEFKSIKDLLPFSFGKK